MPTCTDLISTGYDKQCREPKKGYKNWAILLNYDDIDWDSIVAGTDPNVITTFPLLRGGKQGYKVVQYKDPFNGTGHTFHEGTYFNSWDKTLVFATLTRDAEQNLKLNDPMANGKYVAIVYNEDGGSGGEATFEIFGYHNGLKMTACEHNPYGDTYGGDLFTLTETEAARSAMYLNAGTVATTLLAVEGYLVATPNA